MTDAISNTLYAWVHPLAIDPWLDHTWVTNYEPPPVYNEPSDLPSGALYWYCWGEYHPEGEGGTGPNEPGGIGYADGDVTVSSCICAPNDTSAHGSIFYYGIDGVCHQLANQVLFSTTGPLTVKNARGYWISSLLYGTYGLNTSDWIALVTKCAGAAQSPPGGEGVMPDDFDDHITEVLGADFDEAKRARLRELRESFQTDVQASKSQLSDVTAPDLSAQLNRLVNEHLAQAVEILGQDDYEKLFGTEAGRSVTLVDPAMVALSLEQNR